MKTSVLIPAFNEERNIAKTLNSLPADLVSPLVVVNGSSDRTAEIARSYGVEVLETERRGKMPAIQLALKEMGARALEPLLLIDADTRPLFPRLWANGMTAALHPENSTPAEISAPVWFTSNELDPKSTPLSAVARSLYRQIHGGIARVHPTAEPAYYGPNQGLKIANEEALEAVLAVGHIWPKEDVATADAIRESGGTFTQLIDPRFMATSPESAAFAPLIDYIKRPAQVDQSVTDAYRRDAPEDSTPYGS